MALLLFRETVGEIAMMLRLLLVLLYLLPASSAFALEAPGAPGVPHAWAPALKQAVGTAYEATGARSPVWFTMAEGILTEIFYPRIDQPQIGDLQFLVTDGQGFFSEQKRDTVSRVEFAPGGHAVVVSGSARNGRYSFEQVIVSDPAAPVVRVQTRFKWTDRPLRVFILLKPALHNQGSGNLAYARGDALLSSRTAEKIGTRSYAAAATALLANVPFRAASAGYVGVSDGWQDVSLNFRLTQTFAQAGPGNVALTAELAVPSKGNEFTYETVLAFAPTAGGALNVAQASWDRSFDQVRAEYDSGWNAWLAQNASRLPSKSTLRSSPFARRSAVTMKMHEDKLDRGAMAASLSKPGFPGDRAGEGNTGGYHLIWPRDLYHTAMGLLAAGDTLTPVDVVRYLKRNQRTDGSWTQNFWVDGAEYWPGLQLDEVAFPILLVHHLQKRGLLTLGKGELAMVRRAASFIVKNGPTTQQDRWEEIGGYVPSTLAPMISALRQATRLTGDSSYARVADQWSQKVEEWMLVRQGAWGRDYYIRVSPSGNPNGGRERIDLANGGGPAWADEILDGGFLELVRQGVRSHDDRFIRSTLGIYESPALGIAGNFGSASSALHYRRYNRDAYGPASVGGFWPLLAGERGMYAVAAGDRARAIAQLSLLEQSALPSGMIPEQVIDPVTNAPGLGSACPLAWAHAEDLVLRRSIEDGAVFDAP